LPEVSKIAEAEAAFKSLQKDADEKREAREQYEAQARAVREKTAHLRALRLAKEAAALASDMPITRKTSARQQRR
jgi:hypothetical protein